MKKLLIGVMLLVAAMLGVAGSANAAGANLLGNGGFEQVEGSQPAQWSKASYLPEGEATAFTIVKGQAHSGDYAVMIENKQANDARWTQAAAVKPETKYRLSAWVNVEGTGSADKGAHVTVEGIMITSKQVGDTKGQWQLVELYGTTGKQQNRLSVQARLGFFGGTIAGKAMFDDIALEEVEQLPNGVKLISFDPTQQSTSNSAEAAAAAAGRSHAPSTFPILLFSLLYIGLVAWVYRFLKRHHSDTQPHWLAWPIAAGAALLLRLIIAPMDLGHHIDMALFKAWATQSFSGGILQFYNGELFVDYPPGYIYILYAIGAIRELFSLANDSTSFTMLIKLPAMLADIGIGYLLYRIAIERKFSSAAAVSISLLYIFNPMAIVNSAAWGQVDSVFTLVILYAVYLLVQGRLPLSAAVFAFAILIKPQALMLGPLLLFAVIHRRSWTVFLKCVGYGLAVIAVLAVPFTIHKPGGPLWLVELYTGTLSQYPYASLNAFNLYGLLGGNWQPTSKTLLFIPYSIWSVILVAATVVACAYLYFKSKADETKLYFIGFLLSVSVFMMTVKMHERYMFYGVVLGLASVICMRDRRLLLLYAGFSLTQYVNAHDVLMNSWANIFHLKRFDPTVITISLANTILFVAMLKTAWSLFLQNQTVPLVPAVAAANAAAAKNAKGAVKTTSPSQAGSHKNKQARVKESATAFPPPPKLEWSRLDTLLITGLTVVYAAIALFQLGSLKAPETYWQPARQGESVIVDLGSAQTVERINSFAAVGDGSFKLFVSQDGTSWGDAFPLVRDGGNVFAWKSIMVNKPARYVKLQVDKPGTRLSELAIYGPGAGGGEKPLAIQSYKGEQVSDASVGKIDLLFDEQGQAAYKATFMNSTYFDEIYHARTAYEHSNQLEPFESTHPPLGKVIIALGTWIFGMNPFGWRIMGTLFGILMVPLMYVFAKRLFHNKAWYAFAAAFLLAFDFMHFVQTRIATIDVYGVFFIVLAFYFMYHYMQLNFHRDGLKRTLIPLALCGLAFGLGVASKWIGLYAGVGLAILFFLSLWERYREYLKAPVKWLQFPRYAGWTIGWCVVWFVAVPLIIYVMSYIPFLNVPGPGHGLADIVSYQKHMYNYHSELKATHPFSSTWYEWPTMVKPVWYYGGSELPPGKASLIVALGNPLIWGWIGIGGILAALWMGYRRKDRRVLFLAIALGSVYVPWMLVPRLTFIYHFFAVVPFMILCLVYVIERLREETAGKPAHFWANAAVYAYLGLVLLMFMLFYPILSGAEVNREYVETFLKWKDTWQF
ncbi:phospholipid carrier-dependent glycosyltransferase [Paenibacillus koleovorans]|uniref:phospholipid carrier-dependent glycosyltransferase n=1 Tax=Paenibacillus koleovorans TaxID=121608 RepID=UPI000FDA18DD|nr:phospholipid carrier-dependent glycosyltransferase [Paenibacillus koleovorans]